LFKERGKNGDRRKRLFLGNKAVDCQFKTSLRSTLRLRRTTMKRIVSALLALAASATLVFVVTSWKHGVTPVHAQGGCSVATLTGNYAFSQPGWAPLRVNGNQLPFVNVGVLAFDGSGTLSISFTDVFHGVVSTETDAGTYTVNPDCTGSASVTAGPSAGITFNVVIIGDGAELFGNNTTTGFTSSFDAKKQ
jgi:hypothetical protein